VSDRQLTSTQRAAMRCQALHVQVRLPDRRSFGNSQAVFEYLEPIHGRAPSFVVPTPSAPVQSFAALMAPPGWS